MDLGALGERIRKHGGGWLVDPTDPEAALSVIMAAREPDEYRRVVDSIDVGGLPSVQNMAEAYDRLYQRVLYRRRSFRGAAGARPTHVEGHLVRSGENFPGSAHVRVLRRFLHPSMDSEVRFSLASPADAADGHQPDLVLVQRTAIPGESIDEFFARANSIGARVVFDIDDDLLSPPEDTDSRVPYDETVGAVRECIRRADLVTVSTEPLKERFAPIAEGRVIVVPNQLDERLWRVDRDVPIEHAGQGLRLVYVGSMTHGSDLQRVRDAIERLRASGVEVSLDVVGGERPGPGQDWYRRVQIPRTAYPHFVPWLQEQASHWDVALAPLENTYFNEAKSDVKFLEYAALGIPGVYSSVGPYATSVRHGETGLLVSSEDDWADQIMTLVEQPDFRSTIARAARDQVLESRTIDRANHVIRDVLVELATVDFEEGR
jgi:glycosyltransferase involved in cell wall biosynthesis